MGIFFKGYINKICEMAHLEYSMTTMFFFSNMEDMEEIRYGLNLSSFFHHKGCDCANPGSVVI